MKGEDPITSKPTVLITGASTGIGATYADRFARRGHDLVLVARNNVRMETLAGDLRRETGVNVDILRTDLTDIREAPVRLASAVAPRFAQAGQGAIVNIGSVIGLAPEYGSTVYGATVYGATKAFILFLSQSLHAELSPKGVYVQAALPAAVRTEIWAHAGKDVNKLPAVMEVDEFVDAALAGFDRREVVTIPPLSDATQWTDFEAARKVMFPNFAQVHAAARYRNAA
ncbi:MAG: SDR family NAD(P)-dependent oxidoreductase [Candidatus Sulfotelmatobacter sp.]